MHGRRPPPHACAGDGVRGIQLRGAWWVVPPHPPPMPLTGTSGGARATCSTSCCQWGWPWTTGGVGVGREGLAGKGRAGKGRAVGRDNEHRCVLARSPSGSNSSHREAYPCDSKGLAQARRGPGERLHQPRVSLHGSQDQGVLCHGQRDRHQQPVWHPGPSREPAGGTGAVFGMEWEEGQVAGSWRKPSAALPAWRWGSALVCVCALDWCPAGQDVVVRKLESWQGDASTLGAAKVVRTCS